MESDGVARSGWEAWNRVGEISNSSRLVYRHGSGVGHRAQINGVDMVDSAAAGEIHVGHEWAHRRTAGIDLDIRWNSGCCARLVRRAGRSARAARFHDVEVGS